MAKQVESMLQLSCTLSSDDHSTPVVVAFIDDCSTYSRCKSDDQADIKSAPMAFKAFIAHRGYFSFSPLYKRVK